jgi:hypothetical protein
LLGLPESKIKVTLKKKGYVPTNSRSFASLPLNSNPEGGQASSDDDEPITGVSKKLLNGRLKKEDVAKVIEVKDMYKPAVQWNQLKLHEDNMMLIKPNYDASNQ